MRVHRLSAIAIGYLAMAASLSATAQDQESQPQATGGLLDEVTVTAQRREERIQDVPIAVTAFSADQLERLNITETMDLGRFIPNLVGHNNTGLGTANVYSLRGLSNTESIATFDPPVGSYVDDVFVARQNANNFSFFDVDRVEVLRGPQGTLFGRNTTGGAVNVIMKKPAEEFTGFFEGGVGQFEATHLRASVDIPFSETFLTKWSAYHHQDDGWVSNATTGEDDINSDDNFGGRLALRWKPSENLTWDVAGDLIVQNYMVMLNFKADDKQSVGATTRVTCPAGSVNRSRYTCTGLRTDRSNLVGFVANEKQNFELGNDVRNWSATSNLEWRGGLGTLNFITGWRNLEQKFAIDFFNDPAPTGGFTIVNDGDHDQFTQEIKLTGVAFNDKMDYVAGVFYLDEDDNTDFADIFVIRPMNNIALPAIATLILEDRILDNTAESWAGYTQLDFHFGRFTLTGGVRYTDEKKEIDFTPNTNPRITRPPATRISTANILAQGIPVEQDVQVWTPRAALQLDVDDDLMFFASATRGFKSGGWNARGTTPDQIQPFSPEYTWSYEAGMRSEWLDGKLRFNVTGFYAETEDFQLPAAFVTATGAIQFITRNFASLENHGVEIEFAWAPTDAFTLFTNIGIQNPSYNDLDPSIIAQQQQCQAGIVARCGQGIVDPSGNIAEPVRAPDTYTVGGEYVFRFANGWSLVPSARVTQYSDQNVSTAGTPAALVDQFRDIGAQIALAGDNWSVTASCSNCTDELEQHSILAELQYYQEPRTWSVLYKYRF